jgi:hypothetical protein
MLTSGGSVPPLPHFGNRDPGPAGHELERRNRPGDGYTPDVQERTRFPKTVATAMLVALCVAAAPGPAAEVTVATPDGATVEWSAWIEEHGPAAVVLWASWAPGAKGTMLGLADLDGVAGSKGLDLVLVSVQEDAAKAGIKLADSKLVWLHDRWGALLKHYRIVTIPAMLIVDRDGTLLARLDATPEALREWTRD